MPHPVLVPGAVAVMTGGASGIDLAAARAFIVTTTPPGNPASNVSNAGVKAVIEAFEHELRRMTEKLNAFVKAGQ